MSGLVDQALDRYLAGMGRRGIDPGGVRVGTLAALVGVSTAVMGAGLQQYRTRQPSGRTRYIVGCEGYGNPETSSTPPRWKILAKPGSDPKTVQKARLDHAVYLAGDTLRRAVNDYAREIFPGLRGAARDHIIETASRSLLAHLEVDVRTAVSMVRDGAS